MSKHTPGPWTVVNSRGILDIVHEGDLLAQVWSVRPGCDGNLPADSNASLMAAAPDLLEALESFVALSSYTHSEWDADNDARVGKMLLALSGSLRGYRADIDKIHAAIAKAKGGAA